MSKLELLDMIAGADLDEAELKALKIIVGAMVSKNKSCRPIETVTVPDLPAASLLAVVKEKAGLTFINPGYERYGFVRDDRGKTYEVAEWAPDRRVSSKTVCEHFRTIGGGRPFTGNPGVFLAWVMRKDRPAGWYASIPDDDQCFSDDGKLYAPYFRRVDSHRRLCLDKVADSWHDDYVFLAFREIPEKTERYPIETVTVPDLPAEALLAVAKEQAGLTYLNPDYQKYAFIRDERGKTYEVLTWKPGRGVSSDTVREHFNALGFKGNAAAFVSYVARNHPEGWFVSIPEDDKCFVVGGALLAPYFSRVGSYRGLSLNRLAGGWNDVYVFVAFREIPQK